MSTATTADKRKWKTKAAHLLELLQERPRTSAELIVDHGHRFSASKRVLVEQGYDIRGDKTIDGDILWSLVRHDPRVEVTEEMKAAYYSTPHWKTTRSARLAMDRNTCVFCGLGLTLQVHHWRYDLFAEQLHDLSTVCRQCHEWIHENENITIHFPHYVTPEIAARIHS